MYAPLSKDLKFKNSCYEFQTWEARNPKGRIEEERRKATSYKKNNAISELPSRQLAKEQSPDIKQIDYGLRALKTDGHVEGHAW